MTTTCKRVLLTLTASLVGLVCLTPTLDAESSIAPTGVPVRVQLSTDLQRHAARMIQRSPTFRRQLERLGNADGLAVTVHLDLAIDQRSYRARSVIHRRRNGQMAVTVAIGPQGSPVEWIAHEFEHILEQLEGLHLPSLAGTNGIWRAGDGEMFETDRAIRVGRLVVREMRVASPQTFLCKKAECPDEIVGTE